MATKIDRKWKHLVETRATDVEADLHESGDREADNPSPIRSERTELAPAEALKWDVHGDQSPCQLP